MSSLLVLLPPGTPGPAAEWSFAQTDDGSTAARHGSAPAALLPLPRGAGAEIVAVVPAQALAWHRVELPRGASATSPRLRAVLEGLLEEQLLDEPESVHLVLQPGAQPGAPAWVAVCDRAWLRQAVQALEAAGRPVARIVPEFAPEGPLRLQALGEPQDARLVVAGETGVLALPLQAPALAEQVFPRPPALQPAAERWVQAAATRWDLAQYEFARSGRARALKKLSSGWGQVLRSPQWRPARWGAAVLVAAHLVGLNAWAWKERSQLQARRDAIQRTLTETFPHVKVIVDAPVQMAREVDTLRQRTGAASGRDLDAMLAAAGAAVPPGRTPAAIRFIPGELQLQGLALSSDEAAGVTANLRSMGYGGSPQGDAFIITAEQAP